MGKLFDNEYDLPFPWPHTALSVWLKYPNPFAPHVVSMDVIDQRFDEQSGKIRIERLLGVKQSAPMWAVRVSMLPVVHVAGHILTHEKLQLLGGSEDTYVREVTMVDPSTSSFEMTSTK
jgi:hypothetical protein